MSDDDTDAALSPREQVEATVWRILRSAYVSILAPGINQRDDDAVSRVLDKHFPRMQQDHRFLMTCFDQGIAFHLSALQEALHKRTAMDDDLIDEMMGAVAAWSGEDTS